MSKYIDIIFIIKIIKINLFIFRYTGEKIGKDETYYRDDVYRQNDIHYFFDIGYDGKFVIDPY